MRTILVVLVLLVVVVCTVGEPLAPTATITAPAILGPTTPIEVTAHDRGWGLADVEVRLVPSGGGEARVLAQLTYPRSLGIGSGVRDAAVSVRPDAGGGAPPEGPAVIEVWARDWSWLNLFRSTPTVVHTATVDLTPPRLEVLSSQHRIRVGGGEALVYRVSPDTAESGVVVGDAVFPGTAGYFTDPTLRVALFAIPYDQPTGVPTAFAVDAAGNRRTATIDARVTPTRFPEKTLELTDAFLQKKVPELLAANDMPPATDLVEGYLRINRDLRARTEARVREICRPRTSTRHWNDDGILRLPNAAPLAGYGDRRTYRYAGRDIDKATHLGFDLASLQGATVPAATGGMVVFAGPLGIYGNTVILDHGLGLYTLYGHLRQIDVQAGASVERGQAIGLTGDTGLAGGDHLHFSTMIGGVHVTPIEWWDGHWIHDHAVARLAPYEGGGGTS
jgi:murein DD-endopeptidase MepM/ murein hydrolase activator NlpD